MSKRSNGKGKLPPFTALFRHTTKSDAWRALSVGARAVFLILQSNHNSNMQNAVGLSTRDGSAELGGVRPHNITLWLNEAGALRLPRQASGLPPRSWRKKASLPSIALTDRYYAGKAPTYDFQSWDGVLFEPKKRKASDAERAPG